MIVFSEFLSIDDRIFWELAIFSVACCAAAGSPVSGTSSQGTVHRYIYLFENILHFSRLGIRESTAPHPLQPKATNITEFAETEGKGGDATHWKATREK